MLLDGYLFISKICLLKLLSMFLFFKCAKNQQYRISFIEEGRALNVITGLMGEADRSR